MNVLEILKLANSLSVGLDEPTEEDLLICLKYLNLIHFELYRRTAVLNEDAQCLKEQLNVNNGVADKTAYPIFKPKVVWLPDSNVVLKKTTLSAIQNIDPDIKNIGNCNSWYYFNGLIFVYPLDNKPINILYLPTPLNLEINSQETDIPYPPFFHQVLVDGICYYIFLNENDLKDPIKSIEFRKKYENGQAELISYLKMFSDEPNLSTYQDI